MVSWIELSIRSTSSEPKGCTQTKPIEQCVQHFASLLDYALQSGRNDLDKQHSFYIVDSPLKHSLQLIENLKAVQSLNNHGQIRPILKSRG